MPKTTHTPDLSQALSHEVGDKRIDILRRIGEAGSISEAARAAGVSYKAAWQAIETLSNLAGTPLAEKAVGGTGGGGAQLSAAGQQVLQAATVLAQARSQLLAQLSQNAPTGLSALSLRTSMRNQLPCHVQSLKKMGQVVRVVLNLGQDQTLTARITRESAQLLDLTVGQAVLALCKATAVRVQAQAPRTTTAKSPDLNVLTGQVTRLSSSSTEAEVSLRLSTGAQLVGFARVAHGLKKNQAAVAVLDEAAVVIALA
jgi:molybdate transport system regulatory protein